MMSVSDTPEFQDLLKRALAWSENATPQERAEMRRAQQESYVIAEAGMGSDADEGAYRAALLANDTEKLARLDVEAGERMRRARVWLGRAA